MKFKKSLLIIGVIICLFAMASASASDVNDTLISGEDTEEIELSNENEMESPYDNLGIIEEQNVTQTDNEEKIGATDSGTFWALEYKIGSASSGDTVYLENNYSCEDSWTQGDGIHIDKSNLVIDGQGHTIDAKQKTRIFLVNEADNVTIKNITFINTKVNKDLGGAIYLYYSNSSNISGCSFVNCHADHSGGAIAGYYSKNSIISDCSFVKCSNGYNGGAIYWYYSKNGIISGCSFVNCHANIGGAIWWRYNGNKGIISDCVFINNADYSGKTIYMDVCAGLDRNWFGNTAENYGASPNSYIDGGVSTDNWLFLNATVNPESISIAETADIIFKLYLYNSTSGNITDYTSLTKVDLTLNSSGKFDKNVTGLDEKVTFTPTNLGTSSITATIENVTYTIDLNIKFNPDLSFGSQSYDYSDNVIIVLNYNASATGTVNITFKGKNGNKYTFTNLALNATIILPEAINADEYEVNVTYSGDYDFWDAAANGTLTVNKASSTLTINDIIFEYGTKGSMTVSFTNATGVDASVIGQPNAIVVVNDTIITVSGLDVGNCTLAVTTIPDENHIEVTKNALIIVNKCKTEVTVNLINTTYNSNDDLVITLKDSIGTSLSNQVLFVDLNGVKMFITDENGQVKVSTYGLDANTYATRIVFNGDNNYIKSNAATTVTISKDSTNLMAGAVTATYNVNKDLVIILKDSLGNSIKGATVTVDLNGVKTFTTNANGQIKVATANLAPKAYVAKITFKGNGNYLKSTKDVKVTVKKATPKLTAKAKTFKKSVKTKKYTITLKDNVGKVMKNTKVTIKVNKKTYTAKTNAKGVATFKITKLTKKGKYTATVTFKGNAYYNKVTKKVKITIK